MSLRVLPPAAPYLTAGAFAAGLRAGLAGEMAVADLQRALADYAGTAGALVASSGRASLYVLLRALARRAPSRTEVVLPAYTCPVLITAIRKAGLRPRLCDMDPETLAPRLDHIEPLVGEGTLAIIVVHPCGLPQDVEGALQLADEHGAVVIEDAAQSLGALLSGRQTGSRGHFGLVSFGPGKPVCAGGGGAVLIRDSDDREMLAEAWHAVPPSKGVLAAARGLAQLTAVSLVLRPTPWGIARRLGLDGVGSNPATWGFTLRGLASSQAGVALSLLGRLDAVNAGRRSRAERISRALVEQPGLIWPQGAAGSEPIYMRLPLLAEDYETRERLVTVLGSRGIGAGRLYSQPLHRWYPDLEEQPGSLLGAEAIAMRLFTLPTHSFVTDAEIERMSVLVSNCCQELSRPGHGYGSSPRRPARLLSSGRECGQSGG